MLDATTQEGFAGSPLVQLSGGGTVATALNIASTVSGATIRGFIVNGFTADAIDVSGENNLIAGNWIGTDTTGNAAGAIRNTDGGINLRVGADGNTVGGTNAADRNVISGNGIGGDAADNEITLRGSNNVIRGNSSASGPTAPPSSATRTKAWTSATAPATRSAGWRTNQDPKS